MSGQGRESESVPIVPYTVVEWEEAEDAGR
jgi:hypothetical protein